MKSEKFAKIAFFLQRNFLVKPGIASDISIARNPFRSLLVYERHEKSIETCYEVYRNIFSPEEQGEREISIGLLMLLTSRGESKSEISVHYITVIFR